MGSLLGTLYTSGDLQALVYVFRRHFKYAVSLIEKSINAKAEICHGDPERDTFVVLRVNDLYEALILALHLDLGKVYIHGNALCSVPSISSLKIYKYGFRSISWDIPGIERLSNCTRYLVVVDARRFGGSVRVV